MTDPVLSYFSQLGGVVVKGMVYLGSCFGGPLPAYLVYCLLFSVRATNTRFRRSSQA